LICHNNNLTKLPKLPQSLKELACYDNQLTEIPKLPQGLKGLACRNNNLTELPLLPQSLEKLLYIDNLLQYPPPEVMKRSLREIKEWMSENPLNFVKSADKR